MEVLKLAYLGQERKKQKNLRITEALAAAIEQDTKQKGLRSENEWITRACENYISSMATQAMLTVSANKKCVEITVKIPRELMSIMTAESKGPMDY